MSAHSLLRDIMMMLGGAVCVGLPMAVAIIWLCSWLPPSLPSRAAQCPVRGASRRSGELCYKV